MLSALILAAGRGTRMAELTERVPKPLLRVDDKSLIEHQIYRLKDAGVRDIVINTAWLGAAIQSAIGDGRRFGLDIRYSHEPDGALETAGGIANALDLINSDPFVAVNADVWIDQHYCELTFLSAVTDATANDAHLVLVDNPAFHPEGDFFLLPDRQVRDQLAADEGPPSAQRLTFSGIGVYRKNLFENLPSRRYPLSPLLRHAMGGQRVTGEHFGGRWISVDTPRRLQRVRQWQKELAMGKGSNSANGD